MKIDRRQGLKGAAGAALLAAMPGAARAQSRAETLRQVTGNAVNSLDPTAPGSTRESFGIAMNVYDRLVAFGRKEIPGGWSFDEKTIRGELAQSYETSPDGLKFTFHLRPDAVWHDGSPVTADDVKWSLDRAVSAKSLAPPQMATGSLTKPEQFRVVDPHTVEVVLDKPDRLALANLCTPYAIMVNSKLAKQHATADDPWAQAWMKANTAAGGAYMVESMRPGEQVVLRRNDKWQGGIDGKLPFFLRVISQTVPEAATRANLIEKGDADLSIDLAASDIPALQQRGRVKIVSVPQTNGFTHIAFNTRVAPFDNVKVRQAIAAAMPYEDMFKAAIFSRGKRLFGADWSGTPPNGDFPVAMPLHTDPAAAKKLLAEAGFPEGFSTSFSYSAGQAATAEPMASLIKESLGRIGIAVDIQKMPDAQFNTMEAEKKLVFFTDGATAWLPAPDYFFRIYFVGDQRWNFSNWNNQEVVKLTQQAQFERDPAVYDKLCQRMVELLAAETPQLMMWQPNHDAVMTPKIDGYTYWFYRQVDFRDLSRV
jgi:peptide/nickel transport system substrate-binding protein